MIRQIEIEDRAGSYAITLDQEGDDHIVTRFVRQRNIEVSVMLGHQTWAWDRAVRRAEQAWTLTEGSNA